MGIWMSHLSTFEQINVFTNNKEGGYGHDQFVGRHGEKNGGQHGTRARKSVR
ncbi:hypothetical protein BGW80DRAFT_1332913 [Lactifluus volemus]|nr:hypothetical protein BGW80DRAFT_1332913 [Lactifluus volemus]